MSLCVSSVITRSCIALARDVRSCAVCPSTSAEKVEAATAATNVPAAIWDRRAINPPSPGHDPGADHNLLPFGDSGPERVRRQRFQQVRILPFADAFEQAIDGQHVILARGESTHREGAI